MAFGEHSENRFIRVFRGRSGCRHWSQEGHACQWSCSLGQLGRLLPRDPRSTPSCHHHASHLEGCHHRIGEGWVRTSVLVRRGNLSGDAGWQHEAGARVERHRDSHIFPRLWVWFGFLHESHVSDHAIGFPPFILLLVASPSTPPPFDRAFLPVSPPTRCSWPSLGSLEGVPLESVVARICREACGRVMTWTSTHSSQVMDADSTADPKYDLASPFDNAVVIFKQSAEDQQAAGLTLDALRTPTLPTKEGGHFPQLRGDFSTQDPCQTLLH